MVASAPSLITALPTRFQATPSARSEYGDRLDRLAPYLWETDALADAAIGALAPGALGEAQLSAGLAAEPGAPAALVSLIQTARRVPPWVEWDRIERGGRFFLRTGILGGLVLALRALIHGYAAPAGNKPLILSGRLREAAAPRLHETSRFVQAVVRPGGLRVGAEGWRITLRVRLMHAKVRRMILASSSWQPAAWGHPINQHDMVATALLFSVVTLGGLRLMGLEISEQESADFMHLWRWVSELMGVDPALVPGTEAEAQRLAELIAATQGAPDQDSRALTAALLEHGLTHPDRIERERARRTLGITRALCRHLVGDSLADQLGVARTKERFLIPPALAAIRGLERARQKSALLESSALQQGTRYWDLVLEKGLAYATMDFGLPERLGGVRTSRGH